MIKIFKQMNSYFIKKPKKVFVFLSFLITSLTFSSIFFLFMTISFKYSILEKNKNLDSLLVENSIQKTEIFDLENKNYRKNINSTLVFVENMTYLKSNDSLAMNISR